jgi:SagB-type dehydrogenase family enzyme
MVMFASAIRQGLALDQVIRANVAVALSHSVTAMAAVSMLNRRQFLGTMLMPTLAMAQDDSVVRLPPPALARGVSLFDALKARKSTREFSDKPLPLALLSTLLWAAFGVNRSESGKRTAPSAHNWQEMDIYAALPAGVYRYDALAHELHRKVPGDVRKLTGYQDFVARAALDLILVANYSRMADASADDRNFFAAADAGFIAQNVYLVCAAEGLATVARALIDRRALATALKLGDQEKIVLAQSVGYPAL